MIYLTIDTTGIKLAILAVVVEITSHCTHRKILTIILMVARFFTLNTMQIIGNVRIDMQVQMTNTETDR